MVVSLHHYETSHSTMSNKIIIPKISRQEFNSKLKNRKYEDVSVINQMDLILKKKRGYVFKMPPPGSEVALMVSGGVDSTVLWALLMDVYKLKVHPIVLNRGLIRKKREHRAIKYFSQLFKQRYPTLYSKPFFFSTDIPPLEAEKLSNPSKLHPTKILESLNINSKEARYYSIGIGPYLFPFFGVMYANLIKKTQNKHIKNIFLGVGANDGVLVPNQSFTALRSTTLAFCTATSDYSWNFASPFIERELGQWLVKSDVISLGNKLDIPLEKTWSCYSSYKYQCGDECSTCFDRTSSFKKAGIEDKTEYLSNKNIIIQNYQKILNKALSLLVLT